MPKKKDFPQSCKRLPEGIHNVNTSFDREESGSSVKESKIQRVISPSMWLHDVFICLELLKIHPTKTIEQQSPTETVAIFPPHWISLNPFRVINTFQTKNHWSIRSKSLWNTVSLHLTVWWFNIAIEHGHWNREFSHQKSSKIVDLSSSLC